MHPLQWIWIRSDQILDATFTRIFSHLFVRSDFWESCPFLDFWDKHLVGPKFVRPKDCLATASLHCNVPLWVYSCARLIMVRLTGRARKLTNIKLPRGHHQGFPAWLCPLLCSPRTHCYTSEHAHCYEGLAVIQYTYPLLYPPRAQWGLTDSSSNYQ